MLKSVLQHMCECTCINLCIGVHVSVCTRVLKNTCVESTLYKRERERGWLSAWTPNRSPLGHVKPFDNILISHYVFKYDCAVWWLSATSEIPCVRAQQLPAVDLHQACDPPEHFLDHPQRGGSFSTALQHRQIRSSTDHMVQNITGPTQTAEYRIQTETICTGQNKGDAPTHNNQSLLLQGLVCCSRDCCERQMRIFCLKLKLYSEQTK